MENLLINDRNKLRNYIYMFVPKTIRLNKMADTYTVHSNRNSERTATKWKQIKINAFIQILQVYCILIIYNLKGIEMEKYHLSYHKIVK